MVQTGAASTLVRCKETVIAYAPPFSVYTATMKSIVPLPDTRDRARTYPDSDIAPGTPVMALFPDTTSFYRAVVQGGPSPEKGKVGVSTDNQARS